LNISRRFVRAMGGDIVLKETQYGAGTQFLMTIPKFTNSKTQGAA